MVNPFLQEFALPNLASEEGQKMLEPLTEEAEVIIVDNLSCWIKKGNENASEEWYPIQEWVLELRRKGKAVIFVHHANKGNNQRGTSKKGLCSDPQVNFRSLARQEFLK